MHIFFRLFSVVDNIIITGKNFINNWIMELNKIFFNFGLTMETKLTNKLTVIYN